MHEALPFIYLIFFAGTEKKIYGTFFVENFLVVEKHTERKKVPKSKKLSARQPLLYNPELRFCIFFFFAFKLFFS